MTVYIISQIRGSENVPKLEGKKMLWVNDSPEMGFLHLKMLKSASKYLKIPAQVMKIFIFHYGWLKKRF
jgi:hypothetical protein